MPRRKRTPEEIARKERTKALMKELNIKDMDDIQDLFKSFVAAALEGGLEAELAGRRRDWGEIHSQLEIFFADRISY